MALNKGNEGSAQVHCAVVSVIKWNTTFVQIKLASENK